MSELIKTARAGRCSPSLFCFIVCVLLTPLDDGVGYGGDMAAIAHRMSGPHLLAIHFSVRSSLRPGGGGLFEACELERAGGEGVGRWMW